MAQTQISIRNARSHNLKGVDCHVPLRSLTVVTGVSGSGKSTLAFDTLYAEGQRRYVTSLSTYARQFLERLPRPEVDSISDLPPAIAIEQRNRVTNARSTVGTATEILDHLRLLYARAGETVCPDCKRTAEPGDVGAIVSRILARWPGARISLATELARRKGEKPADQRQRLAAEGYTRLLVAEGEVVDLTEISVAAFSRLRSAALLLIDRMRLPERPGTPDAPSEGRVRLSEAVASAFALGDGRLTVVDEARQRHSYREGFACDGCGRVFRTPEPALFSFNSPLGACETCQGFGRVPGLDLARVVPDPRRSIEGDAIAPFATRMGKSMQSDLLAACELHGIPTDLPFSELSAPQRELVFDGDDDEWYGVRGFFDWLDGRRYKVQARVLIARYRRFDPCPDCAGARLTPDALCVKVAGKTIAELGGMTIAVLRDWLAGLELPPAREARAARLLEALSRRLDTVVEVGLDYVTLERTVRSLSGGEAQRIQLATALGGSLTAALYVLDEPSIGLHARDIDRLLGVLRRIRDYGNTVVVVEHAPELVGAADHVIDLGPRAGSEGGRLVVEGSVEVVRACAESLTGAMLRGEAKARKERAPLPFDPPSLRIVGACEHNLRNVTVELPLRRFVVVTGVSGAGKSTLIRSVLVENLRQQLDPAAASEPGACERVEGGEHLRGVTWVDQRAGNKSSRSNPATLSKAFEGIRKRFASTREARRLEVGPGWFSFNVAGGRCEACAGSGQVVIDMQFLDDVRVPCDRCNGTRYRSEVLDIRIDGLSIVDVLGLSIDEAIDFFQLDPRIVDRLRPFARVGLGYLTLGQPLSTLSGGEHQRARLALALADPQPGQLYVLDEPTTGLHAADIEVLVGCLEALLDDGGSVIVVEHNLDLIRRADHVIDLGPEGGPGGGRVIATGSPSELARVADSHTGVALAALLG